MSEDTITTKIISKERNKSQNPKAPKGFIYIDEIDGKITVWNDMQFDSIKVGGVYDIIYKISENKYGDQTYTNYSLVKATDKTIEVDTDNITFSKEDYEEIKKVNPAADIIEGETTHVPFKLLGHEIVYDDTVDRIVLPKEVFYYILKLKNNSDGI